MSRLLPTGCARLEIQAHLLVAAHVQASSSAQKNGNELWRMH
ncbi:hypothetical protein C6341_g14585 [Phytophthora cactorum]|nr:hypothetical protein C6341_g14585 [Phytophthora cactorum]